jgi:hypothetical protein
MKNHLDTALPIGIGLGAVFGAALGTAVHFVSLWLPVGIALGSSFGVVFGTVLNERDKASRNQPAVSGLKNALRRSRLK